MVLDNVHEAMIREAYDHLTGKTEPVLVCHLCGTVGVKGDKGWGEKWTHWDTIHFDPPHVRGGGSKSEYSCPGCTPQPTPEDLARRAETYKLLGWKA